MDDQSIQHTRWNCTYHIVFIPKYRRKILYGGNKRDVGEILKKGKRRPSFELLVFISEYFDVSIDYLLTGKERISRQTKLKLDKVIADLASLSREMT